MPFTRQQQIALSGLKWLFAVAMLALVIWIIVVGSGCQNQNTVTLPRIPAWIPPTDSKVYSQLEVEVNAHLLVPDAVINVGGNAYTLVSKKWLDEYLTWCWEAAKDDGISYTPESFDCKAFTKLFDALAGLAASRTGQKTVPLLARLVVTVSVDLRHELAAVATDEGVFVVEPQVDAGPFRATLLAKYPNKILSATFGDFNPP